MSRIQMTIDSDLTNVSMVATATRGICAYIGLTEERSNEVELCVTEAVTNAILHAYHGEAGHSVCTIIATSANDLKIEISDTGTPMASNQIERLIHGETISDIDASDRLSLAESGRGLQIIHDLMDKILYLREGSLNRLELTKNLL